jgi:16S rRNA processing protein RimM
MTYKAHILLGRIAKVHGFEGAVTVRLEKTFTENIPEMESVFIEIEGKPVPFFISLIDYPGADNLRLKFEGYDSSDKVASLTGCRVFLTSEEEEDNHLMVNNSISGYKIYMSDKTLLGTVKEVIENPGQWLMSIETGGGKNILIPLHEHFIIRVDNRKKIMIMNLPEGLIEIN